MSSRHRIDGKDAFELRGRNSTSFCTAGGRGRTTDIKKTKVAFNIEPRMKMLGLGLSGASMEAEAVDSVTSERIIAVVDSQSGSRLSYSAGLSTYGHAKQVMRGWIEQFIIRLDEAHGEMGQ